MITALTHSIYNTIAASRKMRGKPMPSLAEWMAEVAAAAEAAKAAAGTR